MARDLIRGQRIKLGDLTPQSSFEVVLHVRGIKSTELRFFCLLTNAQDQALDGQEVVYDGRANSRCSSVLARGRTADTQTFGVDLPRVPSSVTRIVFALALVDPSHSHTVHVGLIEHGTLTIRAGGQDLAVYTFTGADFEREAALCLGEIYRKDVWRFAAVGTGFAGGLAALMSRFRVASTLVTAIERNEKSLSVAASGVVLPDAWPGGVTPSMPQGLVPSVGLVVVTLESGETATGTGFVITPGGHLLTCLHVIEGAVSVAIALGGSTELRLVEPLAGDADNDLALLRISDGNGVPEWLLLDREATPTLGQNVGLFGFPLGMNLGIDVSYSQGIVNSLRNRGNRPVLQLDAGAAPGSSGGPVFDRSSGRVIAMLTSGIHGTSGMHVNFAIDLRALWPLGWFRSK